MTAMAEAWASFQLGRLDLARTQLRAHQATGGADDDTLLLDGLITRRLAPRHGDPIELVWQYDEADRWHADWIRELLAGTVAREIQDWNRHACFRPCMIVVENGLDAERADYYREAFRRGCEVTLIHLGDEWYTDDHNAYRWCRTVFRGFWSPVLNAQRHVHHLSLGYKAGFARDVPPREAAGRTLLWSFAGHADKSRRMEMLAALRPLGPHREHLTQGWDTPDLLDVAAYRALMDDSVVIPCPGGWSNLDCFRVCEALEAGCIPIVERLPGFDYFREALGDHPMPTVLAWSEAPELLSRLIAEERLEATRQACHAWWREHKIGLALRLRRAARGERLYPA